MEPVSHHHPPLPNDAAFSKRHMAIKWGSHDVTWLVHTTNSSDTRALNLFRMSESNISSLWGTYTNPCIDYPIKEIILSIMNIYLHSSGQPVVIALGPELLWTEPAEWQYGIMRIGNQTDNIIADLDTRGQLWTKSSVEWLHLSKLEFGKNGRFLIMSFLIDLTHNFFVHVRGLYVDKI